MTKQEVITLMESYTTHDQWKTMCDKVKIAHGGDYPDYWYEDIIKAGLADKIYGPNSHEFKVIQIEKPEDLTRYFKSNQQIIRCKKCHRKPDEIEEYIDAVEDCDMTPEEFVKEEEGTFNPQTGMFYCTDCYYELGCPSGSA